MSKTLLRRSIRFARRTHDENLAAGDSVMSEKAAFLRGSKVYLRPLERADLNETYLGWLNDPEVTRYLETGTFPSTMHDLEKFYQGVTGSKSDVIFAIADRK